MSPDFRQPVFDSRQQIFKCRQIHSYEIAKWSFVSIQQIVEKVAVGTRYRLNRHWTTTSCRPMQFNGCCHRHKTANNAPTATSSMFDVLELSYACQWLTVHYVVMNIHKPWHPNNLRIGNAESERPAFQRRPPAFDRMHAEYRRMHAAYECMQAAYRLHLRPCCIRSFAACIRRYAGCKRRYYDGMQPALRS